MPGRPVPGDRPRPYKMGATEKYKFCDEVLDTRLLARWRDIRWEGTGPDADTCRHEELTDVCDVLSNRRLLFVGDSIQHNFFLSVALRASRGPAERNTSGWQACYGGASTCIYALDVCENGHLKFVRNDYLAEVHVGHPHTRPFWKEALHGEHDVVLMNTGVHWLGGAHVSFNDTLANAHEVAAGLRMLSNRTMVVWRTTVWGHDDCWIDSKTSPLPDDYRPSVYGNDSKIYGWPKDYGWDRVTAINSLYTRTLEETLPGRVHFLDAFELGRRRVDRHPAVGNGVVDCLHYCLPGPPDAWTDVLMVLLRNGLGGPQHHGGGHVRHTPRTPPPSPAPPPRGPHGGGHVRHTPRTPPPSPAPPPRGPRHPHLHAHNRSEV